MVDRPETEFDTWPDPVLLVDAAGYIQRANSAACHLIGYSSVEFVGIPLSTLAPQNPSERQAWAKAMFERDEHSLEDSPGLDVTCLTRDGTPFKAFATFATASRFSENWTWLLITVTDAALVAPPAKIESSRASLAGLVDIADLSRMGNLLQNIVKLDSVFDDVARELSGLMKYDLFGVSVIDQRTRNVCLAHLSHPGFDPVPGRGQGAMYSLKGTIAEAVLVTRLTEMTSAMHSSEVRQRYPGTVPSQAGKFFLSNIAAPVFDGEDIRGLIFIGAARRNMYDENDAQFLSELAGTIGPT